MAAADLKETLGEIKADLRRMAAGQVDMVRVQERQAAALEEHMRRTDALEALVTTVREELEPLKAAHAVWGVIGKVLAALGAIGTIAAAVVKVLG